MEQGSTQVCVGGVSLAVQEELEAQLFEMS